jgi:hypothetical protein
MGRRKLGFVGINLTKPPYIGGFRHFAIENLV